MPALIAAALAFMFPIDRVPQRVGDKFFDEDLVQMMSSGFQLIASPSE